MHKLRRLFAVTGHGGTEYCDRPTDETFHREYKKRFARIKAGWDTKDEFCAWSEEAREKRDKCNAGKLTLDELEAWLKES